jgi:hypothetical protein
VLRVAPPRPVPFDELDGTLAEGSARRDGYPLRLPLGRLGVERVNPLVPQLPVLCGLRAGFSERDIGEGAKPHVAALAVKLEAENP